MHHLTRFLALSSALSLAFLCPLPGLLYGIGAALCFALTPADRAAQES